MSVWQKIVTGLLALAMVLLGLVLVVPAFIDWNSWKTDIENAAADAGIRVRINGDLSVALLPSPTLSVAGLVIEQSPDVQTDRHFVTLGNAEIQVAWAPLLSGKVKVRSVLVEDANVILALDADGQPILPLSGGKAIASGKPSGGDARNVPANSGSDQALADFAIDNLTIQNLSFQQWASGPNPKPEPEQVVVVETLNGRLESLQGPLHLDGALLVAGERLDVDLRSGLLKPGETLPIRLGLRTIDDLVLQANLRIDSWDSAPIVRGDLSIKATDAARALRQSMIKPGLPLAMTAELSATAQEIGVNRVALSIGRSRLAAAVNAALVDKPEIDSTVTITSLNLDELLVLDGGPGQESAANSAQAATTGDRDTAVPALATESFAPAAFVIPDSLAASLSLSSDIILWRGQTIRNLAFDALLDSGAIDISRASMQLPGNSQISLAALVTMAEDVPELSGRFSVSSQDLRAVTNWLDIPLDGVRADRLTRSKIDGLMRITPQTVQVYGVKGQLDRSNFKGAVSLALKDRPAIGVEFDVDRLNISDYVGNDQAEPTKETRTDNAGAGETDGSSPAKAASSSPAAGLDALTQLNEFDALVSLKAGQLHWQDLSLADLVLDGTLLSGNLDLRRLSVGRINQDGSFAASGKIREFGKEAKFDLALNGQVGNLTDILQKANLVPPGFTSLGAAQLQGSFKGQAKAVNMDSTLSVMGGKIGIKGNVAPLEASPQADLTLSVDMPKLVPVLRMADPAFKLAGKAKDQGYRATVQVKGSPLLLTYKSAITLAGGTVKSEGKVDTLGGPLLDGKVVLEAKDGLGFIHGLGVPYYPAARKPGALRLSSKIVLDGNVVNLSDLAAQFGLLTATGKGQWDMRSERPKLTGSFQAGDILVDPYLPLSASLDQGILQPITRRASGSVIPSNRRRAANAPGQWSKDTLDVSVMGLMDADIDVMARSIQHGRYVFVEPDLHLTLSDRILTIDKLTAGMFGGSGQLTAKVDGRRLPKVSLNVDVTGSQLEQILDAAAGLKAATGTAGLKLNIAGSGRSQYDIVSSLKGDMSIASKNGVVRGVNLQAVNKGLHGGQGADAILSIAVGAFRQGSTAYSTVEGQFDIENGVMVSDNIVANLDGGKGRGIARVDLPAWYLDSKFRFLLADQKSAPEFGVDLVGPLDQPKQKLRIDRLKAHFVGKGIEGLIKQLGNGGKSSGGGDAPAKLLNNIFQQLQKQ